jgi:hypothetical protein
MSSQADRVQPSASDLAQLPGSEVQVFYGQATDSECRVYAQADADAPGTVPPQGTLRGPQCQYANTLPVTVPFKPAVGGRSPLSEAWIADPCFWTPAMPFLYSYQLERDGRSVEKGDLGIRRFGASGTNLLFERKRWVLRGAMPERLSPDVLPAWHDAALAAVVERPSDSLCAAASRVGVLIVADLSRTAHDVADQLKMLRRWPAVAAVIVSAAEVAPLRSLARNVLFAQCFSPGETLAPADQIDFVFCQVEDVRSFAAQIASCRLPIIAQRSVASSRDPLAARAQCDRLQRDLAAGGLDVAGYVVSR